MKVLFLFPPPEDSIRTVKNKNEGYGLGIPYLSAYLKKYGYETDALLDFHQSYEEYLSNVSDKIDTFQPNVVSITMLSTNRICSYRCIELCRDRGLRVVVGGHHASAIAQQLHEKYPDIQIVVGEGERSLFRAMRLWDDSIISSPLIDALDELPFPDHDLYFKDEPNRELACILTSRGCPSKCSFCALPVVTHRRNRRRSVNNVLLEIIWITCKYPNVKMIAIQDDAFMLDNNWVIDLCQELDKLKLNLKFQVAGRVKPVSRDLIYWMDKVGMHEIYIGLESGSQALINRAHKGIKLSDVENFVELTKPYPKMVISPYLITGLPGETWDTIEETVNFVKKLQRKRYVYILNSTPIWAFPGTEIYELMKKNGDISDKYWLSDKDCPNYTSENSLETIAKMRKYTLMRISILQIFTPTGFYHQFLNAPIEIIKFLWHHPIYMKFALGGSFGVMFPKMYRRLRGDKIEKKFEVL